MHFVFLFINCLLRLTFCIPNLPGVRAGFPPCVLRGVGANVYAEARVAQIYAVVCVSRDSLDMFPLENPVPELY